MQTTLTGEPIQEQKPRYKQDTRVSEARRGEEPDISDELQLQSKTRMTSCASCDLLFNTRRLCGGDSLRCKYCGHKHRYSETAETGISRIEKRTRSLLTAETRQSAQEKLEQFLTGQDTYNTKKLYIIQASDQRYKIGVSTKPRQRLTQLQTANATTLNLIAVYAHDHAYKIESKIHNDLSDKRTSGEWFDLTISEVQELQQRLKNLTDAHSKYSIKADTPETPTKAATQQTLQADYG
jgi:DNA-directed RNA polymerase subunit RPC12/RpoP